MLIGVFFGIAACMIWGCVYVAPLILPDYSPVHIAMMRYLVFGMLAAGLAVPEWRELKSYSAADWRRALALGIVGNIFYYWLLAEACQRAGAPIAGAFTALIPIMVGVIGNMRAGESAVPWRRIVPPLCLSFAGMVCLNWTEFIYLVGDGRVTSGNFWLGVGFAFFSSVVWTWYPLSNAEWLLSHPGKSPKTWSTAQGLALLPCAAVGMALLAGDGTQGDVLGPRPWMFIATVVFLGRLRLLDRHRALEFDEPETAACAGRPDDHLRDDLCRDLRPLVAKRMADAAHAGRSGASSDGGYSFPQGFQKAETHCFRYHLTVARSPSSKGIMGFHSSV